MAYMVRTINARTHRYMVANIEQAYACATTDQRTAGKHWYPAANVIASQVGDLADISTRRGAGVLAALSPLQAWDYNVKAAIGMANGQHMPGLLTRSRTQAQAILDGADPELVLGGRKVRTFWQLIADPSRTDIVCVDRHAYDIAVGRETDDTQRKQLERVGVYDRIETAYIEAAESIGIKPHVLQAATWEWWRAGKRRHLVNTIDRLAA